MRRKVIHQLHRMAVLFAIALVSASLAYFAFSRTSVMAATTVPTTMNFQGRLLDTMGTPVPDGLYNMKFALYDQVSAGTLKWSETRETTTRIQVVNGLFTAKLGEATALSASLFASGSLYFEITLPTPATATCSTAACASWESPMSNRHQLSTSAYAYNAETIDGIDGAALAQLSANNTFTGVTKIDTASATAFSVVNGATNLLKADTTNSQVVIGTSDTTGAVLVLDTKSDTGDPTGASAVAGAMYYNSNSGKFRCYQSAAWTDCITAAGGATLQTAYDASGTPATITTTASKGVKIAAGAVPTTNLFTIDNTGQAVTTNDANGLAVNYVGGAGAIEAAGMRVDYAPGGTSGSSWSGVRIVANATGAASGVTSYGLKLEGPSTPGAGSEVGVQVGGGFDIGIDIASGAIQMADLQNEPASPATGDLRVYAKDVAGRMMLKMKGPSGIDTALQPALFTNNTAMLLPSTGTTITTWGMPNTTVGTASTPVIVSNGGLAGSIRRVRVTSATTANAAAELRSAQPLVWRGNAAGLGGFFYAVRFSINSTTANQRLFTGLTATTGATSTSIAPSAIVNMVGAGWDSADTNLQMMYNAASGTATKIDLGAAFPANNVTAVYEVIMFAPPNGSTIGYRVTRLDTGDTTSGTMSGASLPVNTAMLTHHQYMNNGGTAASVVLDITRVYVESDY
ncbi:MAG: hypothetical protein WAU02_04095 [Candidatus Saccharimonadales bacterium]